MGRSDAVTLDTEEAVAAASAPPGRGESQVPAMAVSSLTRDFLAWVARGPRSYVEAMEAWRSSCPRFTIWEDALGDGLVRIEGVGGTAMSQTTVVLTARGRTVLNEG